MYSEVVSLSELCGVQLKVVQLTSGMPISDMVDSLAIGLCQMIMFVFLMWSSFRSSCSIIVINLNLLNVAPFAENCPSRTTRYIGFNTWMCFNLYDKRSTPV